MTRMRVLVSAFACSPVATSGVLGAGEVVLGWNVVWQLARFHNVVVLTHSIHRAEIERNQGRRNDPHLEFRYFAFPSWLERLKNFQGGIQFYAYLWQIKAYFVARQLHRKRRFELFHHVTYANDWMASFIGALLPVPYIRGPGGGAQQTPKAFFGRYSRRDRLWERIRALGQRTLRLDPFFMLGRARARALLVCNWESLEAVPKRFRHKARLFPVTGISALDLATGAGPKKARDAFHVISAGNLLYWKAFDLGVRAFSVFAQRHPDATFTIVGDGPEAARLRDLIHAMGLDGKVRIENWCNREDLLKKMARADVFLYTSLREGGGAVVIEAMAAGLPIVCLDLAGPGMHVAEGCGTKVPAKNPDQMAWDLGKALEQLYSDIDMRRRMGRAAQERAEREYEWDRLGERLSEIYQNALKPPRTRTVGLSEPSVPLSTGSACN